MRKHEFIGCHKEKICSFWCCIAKTHFDMMPYCEKWIFMGCHIRKTRVTYDAIKQKHSSVRCHNAKNGVS